MTHRIPSILNRTLGLSVALLTAGSCFPAAAEQQAVVASTVLVLDDLAASPYSYEVDGQADRAGRATPRVYDTVFIGQRKIGDQPLSLSRVVLVFDLPPLQDGQRLASATLSASYINDRANDRGVPAVNLYRAAEF